MYLFEGPKHMWLEIMGLNSDCFSPRNERIKGKEYGRAF